jgi:hypothetical protein
MRVTSSATNAELEIKDEGKFSSRKPLRINEYKHNNGVRIYALSGKLATRLFGIIDRFENVWKTWS